MLARHLPSFPDGPIGAGLAVLRVAIALVLTTFAAAALTTTGATSASIAVAVIVVVLALALLSGLFTRPVAGLTASGAVACAVLGAWPTGDAALPLHVAGSATALWLAGPGAYAIDARRHGRREIVVPRRSTSPD